ncbi:MAG: hypothetical protein IPO15_27450 [Anaerolineae bacterium]|uniref:hypothetical protein n=1 Tax=Candidatus Amarolinea dominans TaxID=3140696 RepID=UPI00313760B1|nr:hypothetical protein [Anaerolineae bacterium]
MAWGITAHRDALMVREFDQEARPATSGSWPISMLRCRWVRAWMAPRSSPSSWLRPWLPIGCAAIGPSVSWLLAGNRSCCHLSALRATLARQGITTHLLDRHLARRPLITYRRTRTDLRTLATGRVISRDVVEEV